MSQERWEYLDMAKGIGIFLVVLGHIEYIQESTLKWIFSFHMPLFFVIGGILACLKQEDCLPVGLALKKKAKGSLVPYGSFSLTLLTMAVLDLFWMPERITAAGLARQLVDSITGYGVHILWFLPAYFLANAVFFLLNKFLRRKWMRNVSVFLLAVLAYLVSRAYGLSDYVSMEGTLAWYAGMNLLIVVLRSLLALPFVLLGWYFAGLVKKAEARPSAHFDGIGILLLFLGGLLALRNPIFDLHYLYVEPAHYLAAACSCTGLLCVMKALSGWKNPVNRVLSYLGRNSLVIMCTHAAFFVVYYVSLGMFFLKKFIPMTQPVFNLGVAVLVLIAEVPVIWIFNRYLKHLLGRTV